MATTCALSKRGSSSYIIRSIKLANSLAAARASAAMRAIVWMLQAALARTMARRPSATMIRAVYSRRIAIMSALITRDTPKLTAKMYSERYEKCMLELIVDSLVDGQRRTGEYKPSFC